MIVGLSERFVPNEGLLKDCAALDPKRFSEIKSGSVDGLMETVSKLAKLDRHTVKTELLSFADNFKNISVSLNDQSELPNNDLVRLVSDSDNLSESECESETDDQGTTIVKCKACGHCLSCTFNLLNKLPFLMESYSTLYLAYKFVLTLPTTQVTCERVFSEVKFIKTRLRSLLSQELFEPLVFMSVERNLALRINKTSIINKFARSSIELSRLLL